MNQFRVALRRLLLVGASVLFVACGSHFIPNTEVDDTDENRSVIEFCEQYRRAVELRNIDALLKFADPKYYEDGGNIDATDDLDRAGLEEYLKTKFKNVKAVRYEIHYRRVSTGRKGEILVDYTYSASYKLPTEKGDMWRRTVADNRLELSKEGEKYTILSGM